MLIIQRHAVATTSPLLSPRLLQCVAPKNVPTRWVHGVASEGEGAGCRVEFADGRSYVISEEDACRVETLYEYECLSVVYMGDTPRAGVAVNALLDGRCVDWPVWEAEIHAGLVHTGTVQTRDNVCHTSFVWWPDGAGVWHAPDTLPRSVELCCGGKEGVRALLGALERVAIMASSGVAENSGALYMYRGGEETERVPFRFASDPSSIAWGDADRPGSCVGHTREGWDRGTPLQSHLGYFIVGETQAGTAPLGVGFDGGAMRGGTVLEHPYTSMESTCSYLMSVVDPRFMKDAETALQREVARVTRDRV